MVREPNKALRLRVKEPRGGGASQQRNKSRESVVVAFKPKNETRIGAHPRVSYDTELEWRPHLQPVLKVFGEITVCLKEFGQITVCLKSGEIIVCLRN